MDISKLDKAEVLAALYNNAGSFGMGRLNYDPKEMTKEEAQKILDNTGQRYFDYLKGRVMKVDLGLDELDTRLYNRDNGEGAAERALKNIKENV